MKRMHLHIGVADLEQSIQFYNALLQSPPSVQKADYAKWMLDDPRINLAISTRTKHQGLDHLGIQADNDDEMSQLRDALEQINRPVLDQGTTTCCYAVSDKAWVTDPSGIPWETYRSMDRADTYHGDRPNTCCNDSKPSDRIEVDCA